MIVSLQNKGPQDPKPYTCLICYEIPCSKALTGIYTYHSHHFLYSIPMELNSYVFYIWPIMQRPRCFDTPGVPINDCTPMCNNYHVGHSCPPSWEIHFECTCMVQQVCFVVGFVVSLPLYLLTLVICMRRNKLYSELMAFDGTNLGSRNKI